MSLPQTPQDFADYFESLTVECPAPEWDAGLAAARLWIASTTQAAPNPTLLQEALTTLVPYRHDGSGLWDLWLRILAIIRQLAAELQLPLWDALYARPGVLPREEQAMAQRLLAGWARLIRQRNTAPLAAADLEAMVQAVAMRCVPSYDLMMLVWTISEWCGQDVPTPSFMQVMLEAVTTPSDPHDPSEPP